MGHELKSVRSELEGELDLRGFLGLDDTVRSGYETIRFTFHIESDLDDAVLAELVRTAQARSPVYDTVSNKVPVEVGYSRA